MTKDPGRVAAGQRAASHVHPKVCRRAACRRPFLGTAKQAYCCRRCKDLDKTTPARPCRYCGGPTAKPPTGRTPDYCSTGCKLAAAWWRTHPDAKRGERPCVVCRTTFVPQPTASKSDLCSPSCRRIRASELRQRHRAGDPETQAARVAAELETRRGN